MADLNSAIIGARLRANQGAALGLSPGDKADLVTIPGPNGAKLDEGYEKWARETFHKAGLTAAQVKALTAEQNAYAAQVATKAADTYKTQRALDETALQQEWRGGYERMVNAAKTAATSLGFTEEMIDAMESSVGYAGIMKFFAALGQKLGEDSFKTAGGQGKTFTGTLTPEEAKGEWSKMQLDQTVMKALTDKTHPQHKEMAAKKTALFQVMFPG